MSVSAIPLAKRHSASGFSLVELLITMVVATILFQLAAPGFRNFLSSSARTRVADEFLGSLARARSQAITSGNPVFICPRASTSDNTPACASGTDWSNGLLIVATPNSTTPPAIGAALPEASVLWEYAPADSNISITQFTQGGTTLLTPPIKFSPVGSIGGSFVLWKICKLRGNQLQAGSVAVLQFNGNASLETPDPTNPSTDLSLLCPSSYPGSGY